MALKIFIKNKEIDHSFHPEAFLLLIKEFINFYSKEPVTLSNPSEIEAPPCLPQLSSNEKVIKEKNFYKLFTNVHCLLSKLIYASLDKNKENFVPCEEFVKLLFILKESKKDPLLKLFFNFFDNKKTGIIAISVIEKVLHYIPGKYFVCEHTNSSNILKPIYNGSLVLKKTFGEREYLNFEEWSSNLHQDPTIFLIIYSYIYHNIPCLAQNLALYNYKLKQTISKMSSSMHMHLNSTISQTEEIPFQNTYKGNSTAEIKGFNTSFTKAATYQTKSNLSQKQELLDLYDCDNNALEEADIEYMKLFKHISFCEELFIITYSAPENSPKIVSRKIALYEHVLYIYLNGQTIENYERAIPIHSCFVVEEMKEVNPLTRVFAATVNFQTGESISFYHNNEKIVRSFISKIREKVNYRNFFDEYNLIEQVNKGSFGMIYQCEKISNKETFIVKIIPKNSLDSHNRKKFKLEYEIMSVLDHANIIKYIDSFENSKYYFIVEEYARFGNLMEFLSTQKKILPEESLKSIAKQIAYALKHCHELGIVHKDIKPENILITDANESSFTVKLADFGLSRIVVEGETITDTSGTLLYSAPEILLRQQQNLRYDIWSFGILLFHLATGKYPFSKLSPDIVKQELVSNKLHFKQLLKQGNILLVDLVKGCLVREKHRLEIDDVLNHYWFQ